MTSPTLPVAYCAPGRRALAGLLLAMRGEEVSEVTESQVLKGSTDIILASPAPLETDPQAFAVVPPSAYTTAAAEARMRDRFLAMVVTPQPLACLTSPA